MWLQKFGGFEEDTTALDSWRSSCDEIIHKFPTDRTLNYDNWLPLIDMCRMDPSEIKVKQGSTNGSS